MTNAEMYLALTVASLSVTDRTMKPSQNMLTYLSDHTHFSCVTV